MTKELNEERTTSGKSEGEGKGKSIAISQPMYLSFFKRNQVNLKLARRQQLSNSLQLPKPFALWQPLKQQRQQLLE